MNRFNSVFARRGATVASLAAAWLVVACGGGAGGGGAGGSTPGPAPATPLPDSLAITAPAAGEAGAALAFASSTALAAGLTAQWRFGDGATSAEASPQHRFDRAGSFDVVLRVTNEAGQSREASATVRVTSAGNVLGLICSGGAGQGWCWQQQRPTSHLVRDVFAWSPQQAWAVGQYGEILKTDDGGAHWVLQRPATEPGMLTSVSFWDARNGWAVGSAGVFRTTDGGASWQRRELTGVDLAGQAPDTVRALGAQTALVTSGYQGAATRDGGATWRAVSPVEVVSPAGRLYDSQFMRLNRADLDGQNRVAVLNLDAPDQCSLSTSLTFASETRLLLNALSAGCRAGPGAPLPFQRQTLWKSADAGATWTALDLSATPGLFAQLLWASDDGDTLLTASQGFLYRSSDGGRTWGALLNGPSVAGPTVQALDGRTLVLFTGAQVYRSVDAGLTWAPSTRPAERRLGSEVNAPRRVDALTLTARNGGGDFWISRDGGASFQSLIGHDPIEANLQYSVAVLGAKTLRMLAFDRTSLESRDGGQTWTVVERAVPGGNGPGIQQLQYLTDTQGWRLLTDGVVYRTEDAGKTWQSTPVYDGVQMHFSDASRGWVRSLQQGPLLTDDGGRSWRKPAELPPGITVLRHLPGGRLVGVGASAVTVVSTDNGQSWVRRPRPGDPNAVLTALTLHPDGSVWAVGRGGLLLKSSDGGDSWQRIDPAGDATDFNDLAFGDAQRGWIVGQGGRVLTTRDGGSTWTRQASGTFLDLHTVRPSDARTAWITGAQSLLLATSTGGD
ncbi:YCF48-related protein [Roseateles sp. BYS87W]|uniref:YCF48-related protein n=1 Tax=Pelomonas baiyunensis TaxID=3299026 RepID=A0ABW7H1Z1_9BURK